jgi:hypothetical protein
MRISDRTAITGLGSAVSLAAVMIGVLMVDGRKADAIPAYARQTGQQCAACHNGFPELTPYGRLFKLNGYTFGGGNSSVLQHFAGMVLGSYNNTQGSQQPGDTPAHFATNDNLAVDQASLFYGGAITSHMGVFSQFTYDGINRQFHWDNIDLRYAVPLTLGGDETILGVSVNNNPSVQDAWNTTPAWGYPYAASALAAGPAAATMIEGMWAQQVVGTSLYGYRTLSFGQQGALGVYAAGNSKINGIAPYWRAALQHDWARNSLEAGLFGMAARVTPGGSPGFGTDHLVDIGFDTQYQFLADRNSFSMQASEILENQSLSASSQIAGTNGHDNLRSFRIKGTYYRDQTYGVTLSAARLDGKADPALYTGLTTASATGSPNSTAITTELNYIPFNHGGPSWWPWLNAKFGLQYTFYPELNGATGHAATANNTLYLYSWLAF